MNMPSRNPITLCRIVERLAKFAPLPHRELVQGMVAELNTITEPSERTRFARGAIAAIAHLSVREYSRAFVQALGRSIGVGQPFDGIHAGGPFMSTLTTRILLRRQGVLFALTFVALTAVLLANYANRQVPDRLANGASASAIIELLLLALPFTIAMTIPMAVFISVAYLFMRLGADGTLATARRERHGVRRLLVPVLGAATVIAVLALVSNTQILPIANSRLVELTTGAPGAPSSRAMTVSQLQEAARSARAAGDVGAVARAAGYEVEIQKKFALAAACIVLALVGATTAMRFPRGGVWLVIGASVIVFSVYYFAIMTGEALADDQVISPFVGMWMANGLLLGVALLLAWRPNASRPDNAGLIERSTLPSALERAPGMVP